MRKPVIDVSGAVWVAECGACIGVIAALLTRLGNPIDGGISVACFARDIAGALGFHQIIEFSYLRPELIGIVLGAFGAAGIKRDVHPAGGSSPLLRFFMGFIVSLAIFVFIGCPLRLGLRLAGGDPAAVSALAGLVCGVWGATVLLKRGFNPGRSRDVPRVNVLVVPVLVFLLLVILVSDISPVLVGSRRHVGVPIALGAGIVVGVFAQHTKFCTIAGLRNALLVGDITLLTGFLGLILAAFVANVLLGQFHPGTTLIGSSLPLWNFLSMGCAGLGLTLLGGCPLRLVVLAAQGNTDSAVAVLGMTAGAAFAYNFNTAFIAGDIETAGKIVVIGGIVFFCVIGYTTGRREWRVGKGSRKSE